MTRFSIAKSLTVALGCAALVLATHSIAFAQSDSASPHCAKVGGGITTNFIAQDQTAGTATGDFEGAVGVKVLSVIGQFGNGKPVILTVQHFWVTETGDTLLLEVAEATGYPCPSPSLPGLYTAVYEKPVKILGGTGKFQGATGEIKAWGAVDLGAGQLTLRYSGTLCLKSPSKP